MSVKTWEYCPSSVTGIAAVLSDMCLTLFTSATHGAALSAICIFVNRIILSCGKDFVKSGE